MKIKKQKGIVLKNKEREELGKILFTKKIKINVSDFLQSEVKSFL